MMALTYSEVTVARAALLTPGPSGQTNMASSIAFTRLPTPACITYMSKGQKWQVHAEHAFLGIASYRYGIL
jgi:hypothetical protein